MPGERGPGTAVTAEAAEKKLSVPRRMANFFIGPESVLNREVQQGRLTAEAADQILKQQLKERLKKTVAPIVFSGKVAGETLLAGPLIGGVGAGLLYKTGRFGWDIGSTTYKSKNFFDSTANNFKLMWSKMGVSKKE